MYKQTIISITSSKTYIQTSKWKVSKNVVQLASLSGCLMKNLTVFLSNGSENWIACNLSTVLYNDVITIWYLFSRSPLTSPDQLPSFSRLPHFPSGGRDILVLQFRLFSSISCQKSPTIPTSLSSVPSSITSYSTYGWYSPGAALH